MFKLHPCVNLGALVKAIGEGVCAMCTLLLIE